MKMIKPLLIGAVIGAVVGFLGMTIMLGDFFEIVLAHVETILIALYIIILLMWGWSFYLQHSIKKLNKLDVDGDREDEIEEIIYRKFSDFSLFVSSTAIISVLALSIAVITTLNLTLIVIGMVAAIGSYTGTAVMGKLMKIVYPERSLPDISDSKFSEKLIEVADEGERYVIMQGLYKAHNLLNIVLVFAIVAATIYSIATETPQTFSIVLMSLVLLMVNGRYSLYIRNK